MLMWPSSPISRHRFNEFPTHPGWNWGTRTQGGYFSLFCTTRLIRLLLLSAAVNIDEWLQEWILSSSPLHTSQPTQAEVFTHHPVLSINNRGEKETAHLLSSETFLGVLLWFILSSCFFQEGLAVVEPLADHSERSPAFVRARTSGALLLPEAEASAVAGQRAAWGQRRKDGAKQRLWVWKVTKHRVFVFTWPERNV